MNYLVDCNKKLSSIGESNAPNWLKNIQKAPIFERMAANILQIFLMKPIECGSYDFSPSPAYSGY